jgi:hypothetical protein
MAGSACGWVLGPTRIPHRSYGWVGLRVPPRTHCYVVQLFLDTLQLGIQAIDFTNDALTPVDLASAFNRDRFAFAFATWKIVFVSRCLHFLIWNMGGTRGAPAWERGVACPEVCGLFTDRPCTVHTYQ